MDIEALIKKTIKEENGKFCVFNEAGTRKFGCYSTKEDAVHRLQQMHAFGKELLGPDTYDVTKLAEDLGFFLKLQIDPPKEDMKNKNDLKVIKNENGSADWELNFNFNKIDLEKQIVEGVVYEPDVVDAQGDFASADEIEKAAHNFMIRSQKIGIMHKEDAKHKVSIVESYIAKAAFSLNGQNVRKGAWVMTLKVNDPELWRDIKDGKITGLSMGGRARAA